MYLPENYGLLSIGSLPLSWATLFGDKIRLISSDTLRTSAEHSRFGLSWITASTLDISFSLSRRTSALSKNYGPNPFGFIKGEKLEMRF